MKLYQIRHKDTGKLFASYWGRKVHWTNEGVFYRTKETIAIYLCLLTLPETRRLEINKIRRCGKTSKSVKKYYLTPEEISITPLKCYEVKILDVKRKGSKTMSAKNFLKSLYG